MFLLRRPSEQQIERFLQEQKSTTFSYSYMGSSQQLRAPRGYVSDHNRVQLGYGAHAWESAKAAVRSWKMFDFPWIELSWPRTPIEVGQNVAILVSNYGFWSLNAARIVYVVEEPRRFGFAYGTLLEHAESGEERFVVEWNEDDSVWYDLFAFFVPACSCSKTRSPSRATAAEEVRSRFSGGHAPRSPKTDDVALL